METHQTHHTHHPQHPNIFHELKKRDSILLTLFNMKNTEILNVGAQAPSPSKNYCQLIMTQEQIIFRWWQISLRNSADSRYPGESIDTYEDFIYDELLQRNFIQIKNEKNSIFYA